MTANRFDLDGDQDTGTVRMVSIGQGNIDNIQSPQSERRLSWSDFNALAEQTKAMRDRIDTLEHQPAREPGEEGGTVEHQPAWEPGEKADLLQENGSGASPGDRGVFASETPSECLIEERYDHYELPESTHSLLTTEDVMSFPFFAGILTAVVSLWCLSLALINEADNSLPGNPFGMPAGIPTEVRMAQFLGLIIGVLLEEEIPQGLELIGKGVEQKISDGNRFRMHRIIFPSLLRMSIGYTFLTCLFLTVVQESTVLDIFFDILALQFVESIDDVVFGLSKRGFLGRKLRVATNKTHCIEGSRDSRKSRRCAKRFIRFMYIFNVLLGMGLLTYVTIMQKGGEYRCQSVYVTFGDALLEKAYVTNKPEPQLLIYSHFNGIYKENGIHHGKPRYVEQNKEDGDEFRTTTPAEIVYCEDIESWVFRHPNITTAHESEEENENHCSWLLRSPNTESYDIIELAEETEWFVWKGLVESDYRVSIECNDCDENSDCNYNGVCGAEEEGECKCRPGHFGIFCQFEEPCGVIRSEKDNTTTLELLGDPNDEEGTTFTEVYGRPMYVIRNLSGIPWSLMRLTHPDDGDEYFDMQYPNSSDTDGVEGLARHKHHHPDFFTDDDFFEVNGKSAGFQELMKNYTFVLRYTGRRWYGQMVKPGLSGLTFEEEEYHAFWNNAFSGLGDQDNSTLIISAPTSTTVSPVGVDFYEMRRRNIAFESGQHDYDYSPFGVLIPLVEYEGSGFFHCNKVG